MRLTRRSFARCMTAAMGLAGVGLVSVGAAQLICQARSAARYGQLATSSAPTGGVATLSLVDEGEGDGADAADETGEEAASAPLTCDVADWDGLLSQNASCAAWCYVPSEGIDVPAVLATSTDEEDWWLGHDFWGEASDLGCACIDARCSGADDLHVMCFGHHVTTLPTSMFSPLYDLWRRERFAGLGELRWSTPDFGTVSLSPLCAAEVGEADSIVQAFSLRSQEELATFLHVHAARCDARADAWEAQAALATRAVTLVTCSSAWANQPYRTVVTFTA